VAERPVAPHEEPTRFVSAPEEHTEPVKPAEPEPPADPDRTTKL
jgi:hypothetical protein